MASRPKRPCRFPRCPALVESGYCEEHRGQQEAHRDKDARRLYDRRWKKARAAYLAEHPLCIECLKENRYVSANVVDHIIDHKGDVVLFWDQDNWQSMCKHHHDSKTIRTNPVK